MPSPKNQIVNIHRDWIDRGALGVCPCMSCQGDREAQRGVHFTGHGMLADAPGRTVPRYEDQPGNVSTAAARKATPVYSGVLRYFPDAIAAVARLSKKGNDKHNPGEPLHWSRHKSNDHADCIVRHQMTPDELDPEVGELHAVMVAWRALAQLQLLEEKRLGKSL